jgi:hypothetical protein
VQRKAPHAAQIDPASIQPKKRWTEKQRQQSEKFWEKKAARMRRQEEAERGLRALMHPLTPPWRKPGSA